MIVFELTRRGLLLGFLPSSPRLFSFQKDNCFYDYYFSHSDTWWTVRPLSTISCHINSVLSLISSAQVQLALWQCVTRQQNKQSQPLSRATNHSSTYNPMESDTRRPTIYTVLLIIPWSRDSCRSTVYTASRLPLVEFFFITPETPSSGWKQAPGF